MKNKLITLTIIALITSPLLSCSSDDNGKPTLTKVDIALASLKEASHDLVIKESVKVLHPNGDYNVIDTANEFTFNYGYYYDGDNRSYKSEQIVYSYDLDKETGEINQSTERTTKTPLMTYYKNLETGLAEVHRINFQNELEISVLASQDNQGSVTPIVFDIEFQNPFDFITSRDLTLLDNGDILLSKGKANFLVEAYKTIGVNLIDKAIIKLNDKNQIVKIEFDIPALEEYSFTRINTLEIEYFNHDTAKYEELKPYTNDNPRLQNAFNKVKNLNNYTYYKDFVEENGDLISRMVGMFTEEIVFFHHGEITDTEPYKGGDDYDYKAVKEDDGLYYIYQYDFVNVDYYQWNKIVVTGDTYYSFPSLESMGPSFYNMSANVFKKIDENTYEIETGLLDTCGQYFDYAVWGTHSSMLSKTTIKAIITINNNDEIELIQTGFMFENKITYLNFHYSNLNQTVIPTWINNH